MEQNKRLSSRPESPLQLEFEQLSPEEQQARLEEGQRLLLEARQRHLRGESEGAVDMVVRYPRSSIAQARSQLREAPGEQRGPVTRTPGSGATDPDAPTSDVAVTVETDGDWTELRHVDGRELGVFIWPNPRHPGLWVAFEGLTHTHAVRPMSGGYASHEEAVDAGIHYLLEGEILPPRAEAAGAHPDPESDWQLMTVEPHWPPVLGWIATVDRVAPDGRQRFGLVITDAELDRFRDDLERGAQPRISFPERRLISNLEATALRLKAVAARYEG